MTSSKKIRGDEAEAAACHYLQSQGLHLIERNFLCKRGEIDLVMRQADTTVFVEVRYRQNSRYGSGAESVDWRKQAKLLATAEYYLQQHPRAAKGACRFDVVALSAQHPQPGTDWTIDWIENAFHA
ncbi:MAG: YraN family protein [Gammaproteobacteria bacterium]|nr:YraN family protein [Gammaproteobacteria bacterium]